MTPVLTALEVGLGPDALDRIEIEDDEVWAAKLRRDRELANEHQDARLRAVTELVVNRAREGGAEALILTGSTARGRRSADSDVDYYVVGSAPETSGLPSEVDIYVADDEKLWRKLHGGDDFVQWSLRYGLVLFDSGPVRTGLLYLRDSRAWPDPARKLAQAARALDMASAMIDSGDHDAATEQTHTALSLAARWWLLERNVFPLSRNELPQQLRAEGAWKFAWGLKGCDGRRSTQQQLTEAIGITRRLVAAGC